MFKLKLTAKAKRVAETQKELEWMWEQNAVKGCYATVENYLEYYAEDSENTLTADPLWRIGYLSGLRDAGLINRKEWNLLVAPHQAAYYRSKLNERR